MNTPTLCVHKEAVYNICGKPKQYIRCLVNLVPALRGGYKTAMKPYQQLFYNRASSVPPFAEVITISSTSLGRHLAPWAAPRYPTCAITPVRVHFRPNMNQKCARKSQSWVFKWSCRENRYMILVEVAKLVKYECGRSTSRSPSAGWSAVLRQMASRSRTPCRSSPTSC